MHDIHHLTRIDQSSERNRAGRIVEIELADYCHLTEDGCVGNRGVRFIRKGSDDIEQSVSAVQARRIARDRQVFRTLLVRCERVSDGDGTFQNDAFDFRIRDGGLVAPLAEDIGFIRDDFGTNFVTNSRGGMRMRDPRSTPNDRPPQ